MAERVGEEYGRDPRRPDVARRRAAVAAHRHARHRRHPHRARLRRPRRGPGRDHRGRRRQLPLRRRRLASTRSSARSTGAWSRACWPACAARTPADRAGRAVVLAGPRRRRLRRRGLTVGPAVARHYLDHASTTPLRPEARAAMAQWDDDRGHRRPGPGPHRGTHGPGRARGRHASRSPSLFGVRPRQVVFTSGGTEAINAAAVGRHPAPTRGQCSARRVEHSAVRDASARSGTGRARSPSTTWVGSISTRSTPRSKRVRRRPRATPVARPLPVRANHEVGTLQPVAEIVARCRPTRHRQSTSTRWPPSATSPIDFDELGADLVSISSHKLGGPPGIGALLVRRGLRLEPLLVGGDQERARRAGLENVPATIGFGAAAAALVGRGGARGRGVDRPSPDRPSGRAALSVAGVDPVRRSGRPAPPHRLPRSRGGRGRAGAARPRPGGDRRPLGVVVLVGVARALAGARGDGCGRRAIAPAVGRVVDHRRRRRRVRRGLPAGRRGAPRHCVV